MTVWKVVVLDAIPSRIPALVVSVAFGLRRWRCGIRQSWTLEASTYCYLLAARIESAGYKEGFAQAARRPDVGVGV